MRLQRDEPEADIFRLVMPFVEWKDVDALAKFAQAGIAYDAQTAYVAQVFAYLFLQPADLLHDADTQWPQSRRGRTSSEMIARFLER